MLSIDIAHAKCSDFQKDLSRSVFFHGNTLTIKDTLIALDIADEIKKYLINENVEKIRFECVLGGLSIDVDRLLPYFKTKEVEILGACNSGCAILASYAKSINFINNADEKYPTSMMIHATYDINSSKSTDNGLRYLQLYINRFPSIPEEIFIKILTEKRIGNYGLIFTESQTRDMNSPSSSAFVCAPFPGNCTPIEGVTLNSLGINKIKITNNP